MSVKPDFFIIGAPKCGTTALSDYLRQHQNICLSSPKEPMYFNSDWPSLQIVQDEEHYLQCFDCYEKPDLMATGEASAMYLLSSVAVSNILHFNPNARFIVMVRNPLNMAMSLHAQNLFYGDENVESFEEAWGLQESRSQGKSIPTGCRDPILLQYALNCSLGALVQRAFDLIPDSQRHVVVFDDFVADTRGVYQKVLKFLKVPDDGRQSFARVNERKSARWRWMNNLLARPPRVIQNLSMKVKHALHIKSLGIHRLVIRLNTKKRQPSNYLSVEVRMKLLNTFSDDIDLLAKLIGRDLDSWKQ